jgi:hypothetical protein
VAGKQEKCEYDDHNDHSKLTQALFERNQELELLLHLSEAERAASTGQPAANGDNPLYADVDPEETSGHPGSDEFVSLTEGFSDPSGSTTSAGFASEVSGSTPFSSAPPDQSLLGIPPWVFDAPAMLEIAANVNPSSNQSVPCASSPSAFDPIHPTALQSGFQSHRCWNQSGSLGVVPTTSGQPLESSRTDSEHAATLTSPFGLISIPDVNLSE